MPNEELEVETVSSLVKKPSAVAHVGGWNIIFHDITFTKRQIKNYKKYFNINIENIKDK